MSDKTEQPTPRRLRRARQEGDSAVSGALIQAGVFVVVLALVPSLLSSAVPVVRELLERALSGGDTAFSAPSLVAIVAGLSLPIVAAGALTAAALGVAQTGGVFSFGKLAPDLARANPIQGFRNLFRVDRFVALLRAVGTTLLLAWLAVRLLLSEAPSLGNSVGQLDRGVQAGLSMAHKLAWIAALVGLALSAIDLLAVRFTWLQRLKMSKDEIRREHRQAEGDPDLKAARQRAHREALAGSMLNAVKDATVVIVNPTHLATALL
ncbi:MAG TPA: EscU/YscU/HrcU family type III secretion system export apparatus switch protein, partial [Polyangiaceae bacterium]|nr:EscU/YscU/HrcU family type III secretion system export apparatus switch protein [Polyangiaceae bacterium]